MTASAPVRPGARPVPVGADGRAPVSVTASSRPHGVLAALLHEVPAAALMLAACVAGGAGGGAAALCAGALLLAVVSMGYARSARHSAFAREHVVDLWAMVLLLVGAAFAGAAGPGSTAPASGHHHLAALASAPVAVALTVAALVGWVLGRGLLALRVRRAHTLVSAVVCGGMLAAMLLL